MLIGMTSSESNTLGEIGEAKNSFTSSDNSNMSEDGTSSMDMDKANDLQEKLSNLRNENKSDSLLSLDNNTSKGASDSGTVSLEAELQVFLGTNPSSDSLTSGSCKVDISSDMSEGDTTMFDVDNVDALQKKLLDFKRNGLSINGDENGENTSEENTVNLEPNLKDLLNDAPLTSNVQSNQANLNHSALESETFTLESKMSGMLNEVISSENASHDDSHSSPCLGVNGRDDSTTESNTINLETSMQCLFSKVDTNVVADFSASQISDTDDKTIEVNQVHDLQTKLKHLRNENTSISESSVVNRHTNSESDTMSLNSGSTNDKTFSKGVKLSQFSKVCTINAEDSSSILSVSRISSGDEKTIQLAPDLENLLHEVDLPEPFASENEKQSDSLSSCENLNEDEPMEEVRNPGVSQMDISTEETVSSKSLKYSISQEATTFESKLQGLMDSIEIENEKSSNLKVQENNDTISLHDCSIQDAPEYKSLHLKTDNQNNIEMHLNESPSPFAKANNKRRSSCRVSLIPEQISIHEDDCDMAIEESNNSQVQNRNVTNECEYEDQINLTWEEISKCVPQMFGEILEASNSDILLDETTKSLMECSRPSVHRNINSFLFSVCEKIERDAIDEIDDTNSHLYDLISENPQEIKKLQNVLRNKSNDDVITETREIFHDLEASVGKNIFFEFQEWEIQVVNALRSRLNAANSKVNDEHSELERYHLRANNLHESVTKMSKGATRNARRRSILKKKVSFPSCSFVCFRINIFLFIYTFQRNISSLEDEIIKLDEDILNNEMEMKAFTQDQEIFQNMIDAVRCQNNLDMEVSEKRVLAERKWSKLKSMEGITSWRVIELQESMVTMELTKKSLHGFHIAVEFYEISGVSSTLFKSKLLVTKENNEASRMNKYKDSSPVMRGYIEQCLNQTIEEQSKTPLHSSSDIHNVLHQIEWKVGRLTMIEKELKCLERQHNGKFYRNPNSTFYHVLELQIKTRHEQIIDASFQIGDSYPFAAINVDLAVCDNSDIDIALLERQLGKLSRPGFGYLSRSCDIIFSHE